MSAPPIDRGDGASDISGTDHSLSTTALLSGARRRIRTNPSAILALLVAGIVVVGIDWLSLHDPIPTTGFRGIQEGHLTVSFGIVITVLSRATVPLSSLVGLKLPWLAWAVGLKFLKFVVVTGAGAYALARLLDVPLTASGTLRYAAAVALLHFGIGRLNFEGEAVLLAVPLFIVAFILLVRLFALPGLLVAGSPMWLALRRSWRLSKGYGWSLFGVILLVGVLNHLLASAPIAGPLGSALVGVLHAGTVADFVRRTEKFDVQQS